MLQLLIGQVPEALYFSLFIIFTKRLKEKRILFTILMVAEDGMELARNYEDTSEMASNGNEKQRLMKMAEREKEHYKTVKEMIERKM